MASPYRCTICLALSSSMESFAVYFTLVSGPFFDNGKEVVSTGLNKSVYTGFWLVSKTAESESSWARLSIKVLEKQLLIIIPSNKVKVKRLMCSLVCNLSLT